jgi:hypothetical protein
MERTGNVSDGGSPIRPPLRRYRSSGVGVVHARNSIERMLTHHCCSGPKCYAELGPELGKRPQRRSRVSTTSRLVLGHDAA